jgi:hypothetical protein
MILSQELKYLCFDIWDTDDVKRTVPDLIRNTKCDAVILFSHHEFQYWSLVTEDFKYWDRLVTALTESNKKLFVITSGTPCISAPPPHPNVEIHFWPACWIQRTYFELVIRKKNKLEIKNDLEFKKHFIYLNHKSHWFRCYLIDQVAKNDLLQFGNVSWSQTNPPYDFKYFVPQILDLDGFAGHTDQHLIPSQYHESFAQLISETAHEDRFITEKSSTPLLVGKPFLSAAGQGFFNHLTEDLGFELYDEIFDYSFDQEPDMEKRFGMIIENFKNLCQVPISDLNKLHDKIKAKVIRNQTRAKQIVLDKNHYPDLVKDAIIIEAKTKVTLDKDLWWVKSLINIT